MLLGCGNKMPLPSVESTPDSFGANDTAYIHLIPDWDMSTLGYNPEQPMAPVDMAIGLDEYIFVADSANNRIVTLYKSGNVARENNLNTIEPVDKPSGVAIDEKLNLLIVNNTNKVFVWNQYINNIGVDSLSLNYFTDYENRHWGSETEIDSLLNIHEFYIDENNNSQFCDIAFGPADENVVYITDKGNNRIIELKIVKSDSAILKNNRGHLIFSGKYSRDVARFGSGAGTVDNPRGITCDDEGNIYFTQLGGNFLVQKLEKQGNRFSPGYILYEDPIMDLNRFAGPLDVALGPDDGIFVIDTADSGRVSQFYNRGVNAGEQADLGKKGLAEARFQNGVAIAISDDGIVYVADSRIGRIDRYQYTISDEDLPEEKQY